MNYLSNFGTKLPRLVWSAPEGGPTKSGSCPRALQQRLPIYFALDTEGAGSLEATGSTACDAGPAAAWGCSAAHTGVEEIVVKETGFYGTLHFLVFVNNMLHQICF